MNNNQSGSSESTIPVAHSSKSDRGSLKQQLAVVVECNKSFKGGSKKHLNSSGSSTPSASSLVNVNDIAAGLANAVAAAVADAVTVATIGRNLNLNLNNYSQLRQQLEMQTTTANNSGTSTSASVTASTGSSLESERGHQLKQFLAGNGGSGYIVRTSVSNNHHSQQYHHHHRRRSSSGNGASTVTINNSSATAKSASMAI